MRTRQRLLGLKAWAEINLCKGRSMKTPGKTILDIVRQEPGCFLGWMPSRPDATGLMQADPVNVTPSILIMPNASKVKFMEEKRFDRYNNVNRPKDLGQTLAVSMLFSVYEPGVRHPGFVDSANSSDGLDMSKFQEGTEEGLFTLFDWMDDAREKLLAAKSIPSTDLMADEESMYYSLYTDQNFVVDKRPLYYGFINMEFMCHASEGLDPVVEQYLL